MACLLLCAEAGGYAQAINADADSLTGGGINYGGGAGEGIGGGIDIVKGANNSYDGIRFHGGLTAKEAQAGPIPVPLEVHTGFTYTSPYWQRFDILP